MKKPRKSVFVIFLTILFAIFLFSVSFAKGKKRILIVGGKGIGPIRLGQPISKYKNSLGASKIISSNFINFPKYSMGILHKKGLISGIVVYSKYYATPRGVRVGDSLIKMKKIYGNFLKTNSGTLAYPELGLAFNAKGNKIVRIMVVQSSPDPLLGDGKVIPNRRAGKIALGSYITSIIRFWGKPDFKKKLKNNSEIVMYAYRKKAIKFLTFKGRIIGLEINSYKYRTDTGISINSSKSEVLKIYGTKFSKVGQSYMYNNIGLGFYFDKGRVVEMLLIYPKK